MSFVLVDGARHAMLRHHREFARRAAEFVTATLLQGPGSAQPAIAQRRSARSAAA
ncbi:MAG: hypothetical protein JOY56_08550 [Solirubrobacterales bacterium]|nr:hypothetical protein [Solirubrobacterales bacterium]